MIKICPMEARVVKKENSNKGKKIKVSSFGLSMDKVVAKKQMVDCCATGVFIGCTVVLWVMHHNWYQATHGD